MSNAFETMRAALERIADHRNTHFSGDAQAVAREALAAVQQGVQPVATRYRFIVNGRPRKWEAGGVEMMNNHDFLAAQKRGEFEMHPLYTNPAQKGLDAQDMYYLQDARWSAMVGNCPSFWREGGNGYTTNIDEAGRFTFEEAMAQHRCRETDLPWLCADVDKLRRPTIDYQYLPRSWDEQRAALADQAKQGGA